VYRNSVDDYEQKTSVVAKEIQLHRGISILALCDCNLTSVNLSFFFRILNKCSELQLFSNRSDFNRLHFDAGHLLLAGVDWSRNGDEGVTSGDDKGDERTRGGLLATGGSSDAIDDAGLTTFWNTETKEAFRIFRGFIVDKRAGKMKR